MRKPPTPRWYVDADTLGLAHVLVRCRQDVTFCGDDGQRPHRKSWSMAPCIIQDTATPDEEWIPQVTRAGMAIITRDTRIETRTAEKDQVLRSSARMFAITTPELDIWGLVEVAVTSWRSMELQAEKPGPYICAVTRTGVREIEL
jgi:hypothetical protein